MQDEPLAGQLNSYRNLETTTLSGSLKRLKSAMSNPHLQHMLPWSDLTCCLQVDKSAIQLPTGCCGRVHMNENTGTRIQVENRKFITEDMICQDEKCVTTGVMIVSKKGKSKRCEIYSKNRQLSDDQLARMRYFAGKFQESLMEFAGIEAAKYSADNIKLADPPTEEYLEQTLNTFYGRETARHRYEHDLQLALMSECGERDDDIAILLYLHEQGKLDLRAGFCAYYGGQAVGHGYSFLLHHMIGFYFISNAIIACGYQSDLHKWGSLRPELDEDISGVHGFAYYLQRDCDFLTFIPAWRDYMSPGVYMTDPNKTAMVLKKCFRFFYVHKFLTDRVFGVVDNRKALKHATGAKGKNSMFNPTVSIAAAETRGNPETDHLYSLQSIFRWFGFALIGLL